MKVIAYYLPQFHEILENNKWWGDNFTEWTNVKKAKPLFKDHYQPRVPLEGYYDLLDQKTMLHQAELMNKYNIYGMAFYHYWFNGKLLLEKPAENLLKWKNIKMNFMFFWANHNWVRSWNGSSEILQEQEYGGYEDWKKHFDYMLPFFKDDRYLKKNNKPMVGVYFSNKVPNFDEMLSFWNELARENGFDGLYIIENVFKKNYVSPYKNVNALVLRQPNMAQIKYTKIYGLSKRIARLQPLFINCYPLRLDYETIKKNELSLSRSFKTEKDLILGDFVGWDNTSRHGKRGSVIVGQTPEIFSHYFRELVKLCKSRKIDFLFINAWNEWCEGMYLEPDSRDKYKYLEAIKQSEEL